MVRCTSITFLYLTNGDSFLKSSQSDHKVNGLGSKSDYLMLIKEFEYFRIKVLKKNSGAGIADKSEETLGRILFMFRKCSFELSSTYI